MPSPSVSFWSGLATVGQLSKLSSTLSPSVSWRQFCTAAGAAGGLAAGPALANSGQLSSALRQPSPSMSGLQASPLPPAVAGLVMVWSLLGMVGQLSWALGMPSPSMSASQASPGAVAVGVELVGVGDLGAVVAGVADAVAVAVDLVAVGDEGAVVEAVGLAVAVGVIGVGQRLAVVGVAHPHRTAAATAAAAAFLLRRAAFGTETFGVVTVLRQRRDGDEQGHSGHKGCESTGHRLTSCLVH